MHANGSRTFLVIPDTYDGGEMCEHFVVAHSPEEACEALRELLQSDVTSFEFAPAGVPGEVWACRELPRVAPVHEGVIPWGALQYTLWRVRR
jgi:hypothetical protein